MKAAQFSEYGDPTKVLRVVEVSTPTPAPDEVLIRIEATPMRFADLYMMRGDHGFRPPLPAVPGGTGIGRVTGVGKLVREFEEGDRVYLPRAGTWRQFMTWRASDLFRAPPEGDPVELAQVNSNGITAHSLLKHDDSLKAGDWIIQSAANSNCGRYVIQMAKQLGIRTVNVVRQKHKGDQLTALGADVVVEDSESLGNTVREATGEAPIRLGFDMVGGVTTGNMAQCMAPFGRIALYGQVSSMPAQVPINLMLFKHLTLYGFLAETRLRELGKPRSHFQSAYDQISSLVLAGGLSGNVARVYALDDIGEAVRSLLGGAGGKIVICP